MSSKTKQDWWQNRIIHHGVAPANSFLAHEMNARRHPAKQREALRGSLDSVGWIAPVVVSAKTGKMLDGHARIEEALSRDEMMGVPFVEVDVSEDEERLILATLDPISALATYDKEALESLLAEVSTNDAAINQMLADLSKDNGLSLNNKPGAGGDDYDTTPDAEQTRVEYGDLWQCGEHRVLCGDSTKVEDAARVMAGEKSELCFTSPPYSDQRDYEKGSEDLSIGNLSTVLRVIQSDYWVINLGLQNKNNEVYPYWNEWLACANDLGLKLLSWNIWDKVNATSVRSQSLMFARQHEWLFVFGYEPKDLNRTWEKSAASKKRFPYYRVNEKGQKVTTRRMTDGTVKDTPIGEQFENKQLGSVLTVFAEMGRSITSHPAMFPVLLPLIHIEAMTEELHVVCDPFGGSGTTLIACERTNRKARLIEIEPKYVNVILSRWEAETGKQAQLLERRSLAQTP